MPNADKQRRQQWYFTVALLLLFVGVSVQYSFKVSTPRKDGQTQSAILRWSKQIQAMEDGENIHAKYNYPNAPIMAQLLWPLSELATASPLAAALVWFYLKVAMAFACFLWTFRLIETPEQPFPLWAKILAVCLSIRPIIGDLTHGNVNIFIAFLVFASLYAYAKNRPLLCGVLLALAIACKVTPALFLAYFLWKREWRVLLACGLGLVLFFLVVPSIFYAFQVSSVVGGFERNWHALTSWIEGMILPYLVHNQVTPERENQSLPGVLTRLLTHSPSFSGWLDGIYVPLAYHNFANLDALTVKRFVQAAQGLFLVVMVWTCRSKVRTDWRFAAEVSLLLLGMLTFSERTWKHHCVPLLLPFAVLCYLGSTAILSKPRRRLLWVLIGLSALLMFATSSGFLGDDMPKIAQQYEGIATLTGGGAIVGAGQDGTTAEAGFIPNSPGRLAQVYGAYLWAFFALYLGLVIALRSAQNLPPFSSNE